MLSLIKKSFRELLSTQGQSSLEISRNSEITSDINKPEIAFDNKRFLSNSKERVSEYLEAARAYPQRLPAGSIDYLYRKPYDHRQGHGDFFLNMSNILGLIQRMSLPVNASILEVGCGPGWVTEILALLGYKVTAFDPSDDFIQIARDRIRDASSARKYPQMESNVTFIVNTLEELDFPEDSFDAIIFYDILHHIIDEEKGLENCSKWLRSSGAIGIIEGAWNPGNIELESALNEEMKIYGTLESPFTREYLDYLLNKNGFMEIERLAGINGFFPLNALDLSARNLVSLDPTFRNDLIARKTRQVYSSRHDANTRVKLTVNECMFDNQSVKINVTIKNIGDTILLGGTTNKPGLITIALRHGEIGEKDFVEAKNRATLPQDIPIGHELTLTTTFYLPTETSCEWVLDTIAEHICWLSSKGSETAKILSEIDG